MHSFPIKSVMTLLFLIGGWSLSVSGKDATTTDPAPRIRIEKTEDSRKIQLVYQSATVQPVSIRVVDADGTTLYQARMRDEVNFRKTISFEAVPQGTYFVEVFTDDVEFRESVQIAAETATLEAKLFPYAEEGKWILSAPGESNVWVEVYDQSNDVLFSGNVNLEDAGSRVFDLSQVWGNTVSFRIANGETSTLQTVALK